MDQAGRNQHQTLVRDRRCRMTISRVGTCFDDVLKLLAIRGSRECDAMV